MSKVVLSVTSPRNSFATKWTAAAVEMFDAMLSGLPERVTTTQDHVRFPLLVCKMDTELYDHPVRQLAVVSKFKSTCVG